MAKVSVIGSFRCQQGKEDAMTAVLETMVQAAADEPGIEVYSYHRGEGSTFWFFALMTDADSADVHGQTPAMREAMAAMAPLLDGRPEMSNTTPLAAIGLEL